MQIEIKFDNINQGPRNIMPAIRLNLNGQDFYRGTVTDLSMFVPEQDQNLLRIYFENKTDLDTTVNTNGTIINDLNFTLSSIKIDQVNFGDLLWQGKYVTNNQIIQPCLFFGPAGYYEITFDHPVLKWQLQQQNQPGWEKDYEYYERAWKILKKLPGHLA